MDATTSKNNRDLGVGVGTIFGIASGKVGGDGSRSSSSSPTTDDDEAQNHQSPQRDGGVPQGLDDEPRAHRTSLSYRRRESQDYGGYGDRDEATHQLVCQQPQALLEATRGSPHARAEDPEQGDDVVAGAAGLSFQKKGHGSYSGNQHSSRDCVAKTFASSAAGACFQDNVSIATCFSDAAHCQWTQLDGIAERPGVFGR